MGEGPEGQGSSPDLCGFGQGLPRKGDEDGGGGGEGKRIQGVTVRGPRETDEGPSVSL